MKTRKTTMLCLLMAILLLALPVFAEGEAISGVYFEDPSTGVAYAIPEGWTEIDRDDSDPGALMVVYSLDADPEIEMMIGIMDVYSQIPDEMKAMMDRSMVEQMFMASGGLAQVVGAATGEDEVKEIRIGERDYLLVDAPEDRGGMLAGITDAIVIMSGLKGATEGTPAYEDWMRTIESILYPEFETAADAAA